jgi:hypothetical protein
VRIFPEGIEIQRLVTVKPSKAPKAGIRGEIIGFSKDAERRLRRELLGSYVPGSRRYDMTLTVPGPLISDDDFRRIMHTFNCRISRKRVAGYWRIELQKRLQPHLHCLMWIPDGVSDRDVSSDWLSSCDILPRCDWIGKNGRTQKSKLRSEFAGAEKWAVNSREGKGADWFKYMVAHTTKKKEAQLGWKGKQWGKFNGRLIVPIVPEIFKASDYSFNMFVRTIRRCQNRPESFMVSLAMGVRAKKQRPLPSHFGRAGTWVRYMSPIVQDKILSWVKTLGESTSTKKG